MWKWSILDENIWILRKFEMQICEKVWIFRVIRHSILIMCHMETHNIVLK